MIPKARYHITASAVLFLVSFNGALVQSQQCQCHIEDTTLQCSSLSLTTFPQDIPSDCKNYKKIDMSSNKFEEVPSFELLDFISINISNNTIKTLKSSYAMAVEVLNVSSNRIEAISLTNTPSLLQLYAAHNKLNGEFLSGSCNLITLDVSHSQITSLKSVTNCHQLAELDASHNNIPFIPENLYILNNLTILDLSNNKLQSLSHLPKSLVILSLSGNKLHDVSKASFFGAKVLEDLNLSDNEIQRVDADTFEEMASLKRVDLSNNFLASVPFLEVSDALTELSLVNNSVESVSVKTLLHLLTGRRQVDLRRNPLSGGDNELRELVRRLDADSSTVEVSDDCTCVNATRGAATLLLCVTSSVDSRCWVDVARETTTTTTTTTTTPASRDAATETNAEFVAASVSEPAPSDSNATRNNQTQDDEKKTDEQNISYASYFMNAMGAAKLSFLAFLLLTLMILVVINCIVGPPVVDDRWWEEKLPGDRIVS